MNSRPLFRNAVIFGAPLSYLVIGAIHPMNLYVGDNPNLYLGIHVVQLFSIWGMALMLRFLTEGVENGPARLARAAILPYAIVYSAFDALAGIAIGLLVREANAMAPAGQQAIQSFLEHPNPHPVEVILYLASGLTWLVAAGAALLALRGRVPAGALALLLAGSAVFAVAHPFPPGPVGMTLFIAGLTWLTLAAKSSTQGDVVAASTVPQPQGVSS